MNIEKAVLHYANKNGNPYATLLDAGFLAYEVRLIMHGFTSCLDVGDLVKFVRRSIRDERLNTMNTVKNDTFEQCQGKDFMREGSDIIYRFCHLSYGVGQRTEIVGEFDAEGFMTAFISDPDVIIGEIAKGEMVEVSEVAEIH